MKLLIFFLLCGFLFSDNYIVPLMKKAPRIDGYVDENEWRQAIEFDGFSHNGKLEPRKVKAYIGATEGKFYFAILSELPEKGEILKNIKKDGEKIVFDDAVEIWIDPFPGKEKGITYQCLFNSLGYKTYLTHPRGNVKTEEYYGWKGNYKIKNGFHNNFWHSEIEVPVSDFVKGRKTTEGIWQINLCRDFKQPWSWSSLGNASYNFGPSNKIIFKFVKEGVFVKQKLEGSPFLGNFRADVSIYNSGKTKKNAVVKIFLRRDNMPEILKKETVNILPEKENGTGISIKDKTTNKFKLEVSVTSSDGKEIFFTRKYEWINWKEKRAKWKTEEKKVLPVDFLFAYYPYLNRIRILSDITGLSEKSKLEKLIFTIKEKGGKEIKKFEMEGDEFKNGKCEKMFNLPPLSGKYQIICEAKGKNVPGRIIKEFERKVFEWEHKNLGTGRKVYPPFTPIKVRGRKIYTVMKEYTMNGIGLLSSVKTVDQEKVAKKEILKGDIVYKAKINGKNYKTGKGRIKFLKKDDDLVIAESKFNIGELHCISYSTVEYDGLLKVNLRILPCGKLVEKLLLEIPVDEKIGKMMHAMADGIRYPILTDYIPQGKGVVWDATKIVPSGFVKNFCTYIFIGNPRRGICWFAENDKGWSWDPEKPNMQIIRENGTVKLQITFVNKPTRIEKPQTITFGILAAPVKPYLPGWRHRWFTEKFSILGTDINWFALGDCGSVYPAGKDMYLWEMLKEGNKRQLTEEEINSVIERGKKYFEPYGKEVVEKFIRHVRHNLRARYGKKMVFYYNRASYAKAEEFQTFMDEWCLNDYNPYRGSKNIHEIKIVPTDSYIDHALYWYKKSFEIAGNKGVYWDNYFFVPSYNTMMTSAYKKEDGSIMPSTGLWGLRELVKRTFIMMNELGMEPITMVHMTSTQILPLYSFATVQYDWEWKYSQGDVQNRFPRKYILLVSTGELAGTWPVLLGDHGKLADDPWTQKTFIGVSLIHDLLGPVSTWNPKLKLLWEKYRVPFLEMAKNKDMIAYRYWDDRKQPIYSKNSDLPTIVYSIPGEKAVFGITSYSEKDENAVVLIDQKLLGFKKYKVIDVDDGKEVKIQNNKIKFLIKKHDLKVFYVLPVK